MSDTKREFTVSIGLPSILLIFVVLCLVAFGVLSLVSANADQKLSQKVLDRSTAYYEACNQAEEMLCDVDTRLHAAYQSSHSTEEYVQMISVIPDHYTYPVSDIQYLDVVLSYPIPASDTDMSYEILSWKVVTREDLDYDTGLHLMEIEDVE